MNINKVRGKDTKQSLLFLDNEIKKINGKILSNHLETKELINDTNINFVENEKVLKDFIINHENKLEIIQKDIKELKNLVIELREDFENTIN